ncbi:MAG TPA: NAD(P)/FAD-dependent oxidoreductase [Dehalococcoidia bacterium]|nr:NAD(P)/FAD-dependent oxidoreductase [Dehalococcoidia bacterium]
MPDTLTPADRQALRARYSIERDKRLRPDGNDQYIEPKGRFASLLDDPYTDPAPRDPVRDDIDVAIIGAGFGGLVVGARLKQAGIGDVRLIDKAGDVGGVWYWNRYPGAMCDTAAMIYLPLLEETGTVPSAKYVRAPEIHAHAKRIAETFDLYRNALLSTGIEEVKWDGARSRWTIRTDRGDEIRARFVAMGTGPLHRPKLPGIPGIETFAGHAFHTSRWDYAYTGGDPSGAPMERLADKRVGIIGTGATAVQCIPQIAETAGALYVFQRTPSSIDVRNNQAIDPAWYATLERGWQQRWLENFATLQTGGFADEDLVKDGWTDISQRIRDRIVEVIKGGAAPGPDAMRQAYEDSDDEKMCEIRDRVDAVVRDETAAAALKPWYRQLCKRPCFSDDYLQTYNQPSVHLIDTDGRGVDRIDETGVWASGRHYDLDCLIYASGFEVGTDFGRRSGFDPAGRGGERLTGYWADGMRSLHGTQVHGFPNLFVIGLTQGANLISNITHNFAENGIAIASVIRHAMDTGAQEVEVTAEAEQAWVDLLETGEARILGSPDCTPGYYNNEGHPMGRRERLNSIGYPGGPVAYFTYLRDWYGSGAYRGLEFRVPVPEADPARV